jgi:hypothetical protein
MEATLEEKVDTTMDVLHKEFPEEIGMIRKIIRLRKDEHLYRINYIDRNSGYVLRSYFIRTEDGRIVEKYDD